MAQVKNETKGVMVIGGAVIAPGANGEADESHPGVKRAIKRGTLTRVDGRTKTAKQETKAADTKSDKAE